VDRIAAQINGIGYVVMMDEKRKSIMLVDDDLVNPQVGKMALSAMCRVLTVPSTEKMFAMLERYSPELILLDINISIADSILQKPGALIGLFERVADQFAFSRDKP
jgi:PleD family two-component response regulator